MRPLRPRLRAAGQRAGQQVGVIELDYLQSWILAAISRVPTLDSSLVFKGGTALKKCYFGDYRFSEDLDFSGRDGTPSDDEMYDLIGEACVVAANLLDEYDPVEITYRRYTERMPHPGGQQAFDIYPRFSWQSGRPIRVRVEITMDEPILKPVVRRPIIHDYEEPLNEGIQVYALEEIVAEKLRAILQQTRRLEERTWLRSRPRDYYDIWRILRDFRDDMDLTDFNSRLSKKCAVRCVGYDGPDDFFPDEMVSSVVEGWEDSLGPLVPQLACSQMVFDDLRLMVSEVLQEETT